VEGIKENLAKILFALWRHQFDKLPKILFYSIPLLFITEPCKGVKIANPNPKPGHPPVVNINHRRFLS
jgi:hypothetical protein